ncbi:MAG: hypothetical protein KIT84_32900 [Labilithrix sp.]|nr:hypothetical protein [Labilithrix sp.]MCW5815874.1 hypothetical protein [Labilithrix sp.]
MSSERKRTTADEEAEARSTERPPSPEQEIQRDISAAIKAAKNTSPGRYGPPAATAKIQPFDLAQALALSSADTDPSSRNSSKPPREDDAPFVPPEVEVLGEEEVPSGVDPSSKPPASGASSKPPSTKKPSSSKKLAETLASEGTPPVVRRSYNGLVVLALIVGLALSAYVYVYANR